MTRAVAFALLALGAAGLLYLAGTATRPPAPDLPDNMIIEIASFDDLPGWRDAEIRWPLHVFQQHCIALIDRQRSGGEWNGGRTSDYSDPAEYWALVCDIMQELPYEFATAEFIEHTFVPLRIRNNSETTGMFTGYYEPELQGSRTETEEFSTPLLTRPDDLVIVHLSQFPGDHDGRIAGRVENGTLTPFEDRTEIEEGALDNAEPLAWVRPVDAFFLQIQGSGRVVFEDGTVLRAGYDGVNGHPYTAIGRPLIQEGHLTLENVSMQSIRDWLRDNPDDAQRIMRMNASYVFFREIDVDDPELGPIGAAGVPLTPGYSLAVDHRFHAYGAPVYVATTLPDGEPFQRLMVAQDTGGAIRGPIRGDIFFGYGNAAGEMAGRMRSQGEMWVLVPNGVAERLLAEQEAAAE